MIKDYNSRAYLSIEKFQSSERSLKMLEKPGMPFKCKFANQGKTTASTRYNCNGLLWVFCFFWAQAYLKPLFEKLIGWSMHHVTSVSNPGPSQHERTIVTSFFHTFYLF